MRQGEWLAIHHFALGRKSLEIDGKGQISMAISITPHFRVGC